MRKFALTAATLLGLAASFAAPAAASPAFSRVSYTAVHDTVVFNPALTCAASVIVCPAMPSEADAR